MTGGNFRNIAEPPKLFYDLLPKTWEALVALREQRKLAAILAADVVGYSRQTARR
jgi:class 3 adenylate cyclase